MINDKELSNLDLDLLYSKSNIRKFYKPEKVNIITTYSTDKLPGQQSLEDNNIDIFKDCGHAVIFHRWHPSKSAHWLTLLRDLENNVIIFDSLGSNGMQKNKKKFNLLLKRLKDNGYKKITVNSKAYQGETNSCGKYAIFAIAMNKLYKGASMKQINDYLDFEYKKNDSYDNYILKLFSKDI